jgi:hypothetical protein
VQVGACRRQVRRRAQVQADELVELLAGQRARVTLGDLQQCAQAVPRELVRGDEGVDVQRVPLVLVLGARRPPRRRLAHERIGHAPVRTTGGVMADTVSDQLVSRLRQWGVERIFSYAGDGINRIDAGVLAAITSLTGQR